MNALQLQLEDLQQAFAHDPSPSFAERKERIERVVAMIDKYEENLCKVVHADFGNRHYVETRLTELAMVRQAAKYTIKHLKSWMKMRDISMPMHLKPSKAWVQAQPKGVVGIISPWNYPIQLALIPAISAMAAGNRVWLKLSERSPRTSGYLATIIGEFFHPLELRVITGGEDVGREFSELTFDHLFFTGSTSIGKRVMRAAAENLTPLTLELGGKSPVVINHDANLADAATRIIYGKLINGGQTCVAPDYILIKHELIPELKDALVKAAETLFNDPSELTHPIDKEQLSRWQQLVSDATGKGAQVNPLLPKSENCPFTPVILTQVAPHSLVMKEEIFGPILPIIGVSSQEDVIEFINSKDRPLSIYWFGKDKKALRHLISKTHSGSVTANDTLIQAGIEQIPFGGIGASGMGAYHGQAGFDTFSHLKPTLQVRGLLGIKAWMGSKLAHPPYNKTTERLLRWLS
uniref:aldehyde dehydrogenase family protein n=1 Tax=Polynucleobacter sp. TaxID=2029855 RepID=UPI004047CF3C